MPTKHILNIADLIADHLRSGLLSQYHLSRSETVGLLEYTHTYDPIPAQEWGQ